MANAAVYGLTFGATSGAIGASWAALVGSETWVAAGLQAGWQGALVGACIGAATGIAQWRHLNAAGDDDKYLAKLVELRELFQRGEDWKKIIKLYEYLQENAKYAGSAAQAAWMTTRAIIDPILLTGLRASGAYGVAS